MSKERVIVLSVVQQQLSKAETARRYQVSWRWVHTLVTRYQTGGWEAVEARSRRPHNNSRAVATALRERICTLRCELQAAGLDHGPVSIAARLSHEGLRPPAFSTIRRILTSAGLISPEPKKRPKSSYRRFQADQPNECWQSDFTHWQLADSTGVEIINWLDDHSRYLLASRAYRRTTGQGVITTGHILRSTGATPANAHLATIKAAPAAQRSNPHYQVRNDHLDRLGKTSLRRAGRMHHLGVGAAHKGSAVTILIDADTITVIHQDTR